MDKRLAQNAPAAAASGQVYSIPLQSQLQSQPQPYQMLPSYEQAITTAPHVAQAPIAQPPVVIIQHQTVVSLGPQPAFITCPFCHVQKLTRVEHEPSLQTHLMAGALCLLGFWCCVCVPYCISSCMNTNHYCGNCNKFLSVYNNH